MNTAEILALLNILVAFLGVAFALFAFIEWTRLRTIRSEMKQMEARLLASCYNDMRVAHRVIASYGIKDVYARIALLESATKTSPSAFNVYNALGYAYMEAKDNTKAIDAFMHAIQQHPDDKSGYCDIAYAYFDNNDTELAITYFRKAIEIDSTAKNDIISDARLTALIPAILNEKA